MKKDPPIIVMCLHHPKQKIGGFFVLPKGRFVEAFWCKVCKEWIIYDEINIKKHLIYFDDRDYKLQEMTLLSTECARVRHP